MKDQILTKSQFHVAFLWLADLFVAGRLTLGSWSADDESVDSDSEHELLGNDIDESDETDSLRLDCLFFLLCGFDSFVASPPF